MEDNIQNYVITVESFRYVNDYYVKGHYVYIIKVIDKYNNKETLIERRYSEIEWLDQKLKKTNPGCRIPFIPEKNPKMNLYLNSEAELEDRKKKIEIYLDYISKHIYLSKNEYFKKFLLENFKMVDYESKSFLGSFTSYIPFMSSNKSSSSFNNKSEFDNIDIKINYEEEKENFIRMQKGIKDLTENIQQYLNINETKIKTLDDFVNDAMEFHNINLEYHNKKLNEDNDDNKEDIKNINKIEHFVKKIRELQNTIQTNLLVNLNSFKKEVDEILKIFDRKKEIEESNVKRTDLIKDFAEQLRYEIDNFQNKKQGGIVKIFEEFYSLKLNIDLEIDKTLNSKI